MPSLSCDTDFHQYKSVFWGESGYDFCPVLLFDRRKCLSVLVFKGRKHQDYLIWPYAILSKVLSVAEAQVAKSQISELQSQLFILLNLLISANTSEFIASNQNRFISQLL